MNGTLPSFWTQFVWLLPSFVNKPPHEQTHQKHTAWRVEHLILHIWNSSHQVQQEVKVPPLGIRDFWPWQMLAVIREKRLSYYPEHWIQIPNKVKLPPYCHIFSTPILFKCFVSSLGVLMSRHMLNLITLEPSKAFLDMSPQVCKLFSKTAAKNMHPHCAHFLPWRNSQRFSFSICQVIFFHKRYTLPIIVTLGAKNFTNSPQMGMNFPHGTFASWTGYTCKHFWVVVSNIFHFHPYLGKWSNLIFFSTGLEPPTRLVRILKSEIPTAWSNLNLLKPFF